MPFIFNQTDVLDLRIIEPKVFSDDRGYFLESYKYSDFQNQGIQEDFKQDNHSFSIKGVLRGLHFQLSPKAQAKLVRVVKGSAWDVAVDLRKDSPTFLKWYGLELSAQNKKLIYIPEGFAHGFVSLTEEVHLLYKCTEEYDSSLDRGIIWNDPDIAIEWPIKDPLLSNKDKDLPSLRDIKLID